MENKEIKEQKTLMKVIKEEILFIDRRLANVEVKQKRQLLEHMKDRLMNYIRQIENLIEELREGK